MKPIRSIFLSAAIALAAFLLGRWTAPSAGATGSAETATPSAGNKAQENPVNSGKTAARSSGERPMSISHLSEQGARRMTPQQRLEVLAKGALVYDGGKQADMLCGLIGAMTKEEMHQAVELLAAAQDGGNACAQAVWDSLWKQWGRVDPNGCVEYFAATSGSKIRSDARNMMEGWLEMDPDAALAWAKQAKETPLDSAAASMAITWNSGGDPVRLKTELLSMPADSPVTKECLRDYFDLASLQKDSPTAAQIHDQLPPALQQAAWPVTLQRLTYTDPQAAKQWLQQHASDPGQDYNGAGRLIWELSKRDAEGTAKWAIGLPPAQGPHQHPAKLAINQWMEKDSPAALEWLATLPKDSPWRAELSPE